MHAVMKQLNTRPMVEADSPIRVPCTGTKKNSISQPSGLSDEMMRAVRTPGWFEEVRVRAIRARARARAEGRA